MSLIRKLAWHLLRWPSVVLFDFDGEEKVRLVRRTPSGRPYAVRVGFGIRHVILMQDGTLENGRYCKRWEPAPWCPMPTFKVSP